MGQAQATTQTVVPQFPEFKFLEWNDRIEVEQITSRFQTYSDFNFTSLHIWNVLGKTLLSILNGNLVVVFSDYITGEQFISFIGDNDPVSTTKILLDYSKTRYGCLHLKLIPEIVAKKLCNSEFIITEDRNSFDYIFSMPDMRNLQTMPAKHKPAIRVRLFIKSYPHYQVRHSALHEANIETLREAYTKWACNKGFDCFRTTNEYHAFERLLANRNPSVTVTTIHVDTEIPIGFLTTEIISSDTAVCHFCKADITYKGIYETLFWIVGTYYAGLGIDNLNFEQDLGLENLRYSKEKYKCHSFLKKYVVEIR